MLTKLPSHLKLSLTSAILASCLASPGFSATTAKTTPPPPPTTTSANSGWQFEIAPYLWAVNMNGRMQIGSETAHVNQSFSQLWDDLNAGGMLWLSAKKDKFGLFLNSLYVALSQNGTVGPVDATVKNNFGVFSAGISYQVYQRQFNRVDAESSQLTIEPYAGARYTLTDNKIEIIGYSFAKNVNWTDPIVGARVRYDFNPRWQLLLAGDMGGTNFNNDKSYSANAFVGYTPQTMMKYSTWYAGYRVLYQDYLTGQGSGRFDWNMRLFGPVLGVAFRV